MLFITLGKNGKNMQFDFLDRFVAKKRNVVIYTIIKVSLTIVLFSMVVTESDMAMKIIFLAAAFIVLMSMVPVLTIYYMVKKQNKAKNE
jgi:hypothetical protein